MRTIYTIILVGMIVFTANSQDNNINLTDKKGLKQGKWKKMYRHGITAYEGQFINDIEYGTFTYYYNDGVRKATQVYRGLTQIAVAIFYHKNGKIQAKGIFNDTLKDSTWNYFDNKANLRATEHYVLGNKTGIHTTYFEDGTIAEIIAYQKNHRDGIFKEFYEDGDLKIEGNYKNNKFHGKFYVYYSSGKQESKGSYKNGFKNGFWVYYDQDGKHSKKVEYNLGKIISDPNATSISEDEQ